MAWRNSYGTFTKTCNLRPTTSQDALRERTRVMPDIMAPVLGCLTKHACRDGPQRAMGSASLPSCSGDADARQRVNGKAKLWTTNICKPLYAHWQQYVGAENRCAVPLTSLAEPRPMPTTSTPRVAAEAGNQLRLL